MGDIKEFAVYDCVVLLLTYRINHGAIAFS